MLLFKRMIIVILIYMLTIPFEFLPYMQIGKLSASNPKITIIDIVVDGNPTLSNRMTQFIKDELAGKNRLDFFEHNVSVVVPKAKKRTFDSSKIDTTEMLKEIKGLVKDKEYAMAIESWQTVIETYTENFDQLKSFKPLYSAYLNKSFLENLENMDSESKKDMKQAIAIGRNFTFAVSEFSPRFLIKYKRERKRSKKKTASIKIKGDAKVYINGNFLGVAPMEVNDLSYGDHFIVLTKGAKVVKKEIVTLNKRNKKKTIVLKSTGEKKTDISSVEVALVTINKKLSEKLLDSELLDSLQYFAKNKEAEFIVLGYTEKKGSIYNANIFLYNYNMNKLSKLTIGEFDEDLLTGDVEALRIGKEIVKGVDSFNSLKGVKISNSSTTSHDMQIVSYLPYKELSFDGAISETFVPKEKDIEKEVQGTTKEKDIKKEIAKTKDDFDLDSTEEEKEKNIKLDDADYSKLKKEEIDLNKFDEENEETSWYASWWFWTSVAVVGATGAGVYYLTRDTSKKVTPKATWLTPIKVQW